MLRVLGEKTSDYQGLDTFEAPQGLVTVQLTSDEITAVCPVTKQPDWYQVTICYQPRKLCVESKSLKLFFHSLRAQGMFCEALATFIMAEVVKYANPEEVTVTVVQKARGGISIRAEATKNPEVMPRGV